jgi:hypothetical protein
MVSTAAGSLPAVRLELSLATEEAAGDAVSAAAIRDQLAAAEWDVDLLRRALDARQISMPRVAAILRELSSRRLRLRGL